MSSKDFIFLPLSTYKIELRTGVDIPIAKYFVIFKEYQGKRLSLWYKIVWLVSDRAASVPGVQSCVSARWFCHPLILQHFKVKKATHKE